MDKRELVKILEDMAVILELAGENPFKVRAYRNAARVLARAEGTLTELLAGNRLEGIKGIGKAISQKIREYAATGQIAEYQAMRAKVPPVVFELVKIPGLGPQKAILLHKQLGVESLGELEYACRENRLAGLPGFGVKTQEKILAGIEQLKRYQGQYLLCEVQPIADKLREYLVYQDGVDQVYVTGEVRRLLPVVQAIKLLLVSSVPLKVAAAFKQLPEVARVTELGEGLLVLELINGIEAVINLVRPSQLVVALHTDTGSPGHLEQLRRLAAERGLNLADCYAVPSEQDFYLRLGLDYIEPELREGLGEIEAAQTGNLPKLVTYPDLKGAFHVHTNYSDGSDSLADIVQAAQNLGWEYLGIADHSQTAVYANGLKPDMITAQRQEIERLNAANPNFRIFAGIECDILPDGSLDYPDDILAEFDFVIASIHSAFRQSEGEMTRRIIRALENPYVSMLGHATGRILLAREGYAVDLPAVIQAAADTGTILEINANPYRLDLDWQWHRRAKEAGVLLAINPDAHTTAELDHVRWGVAAARKGWLTAADIINTRPADQVLALLQRKRANGR